VVTEFANTKEDVGFAGKQNRAYPPTLKVKVAR